MLTVSATASTRSSVPIRQSAQPFSLQTIEQMPRLCQFNRLSLSLSPRLFPFRLLALTMSAAALSATAPPQGDTAGALSCPPPAPLRIPPPTASGQPGAINIRAARHEAVQGQPIRFLDNVRVVQGSQQLETDEIAYDRASGRVDIPGRLRFNDARLQLDAAEAWYQTRERLAWFLDVDYAISGTTATGSAAQAEWLGPDRARLEQFDFTTCPPQQRDWQLKASRVDLDLDSGVGTARNARLSFKGIPLLYSPWLSFPLDDRRKTGFLYPGFGYSTDDGIDIQVPWYWNIAPEQDATLTPRWIEKRGVQLGVQYRFLGADRPVRSISSGCPTISAPTAIAILPNWPTAPVRGRTGRRPSISGVPAMTTISSTWAVT